MPEKLKHTAQRQLAAHLLEMIDWQLERTEQQKLADVMIAMVGQNMGRQAAESRVLNTMQVVKLRQEAIEACRGAARGNVEGGKAGIGASSKRLNGARA
jgi:hypothetical protein